MTYAWVLAKKRRAASGGVCVISQHCSVSNSPAWSEEQGVPRTGSDFNMCLSIQSMSIFCLTQQNPSFVLAKPRPGMESVPCSSSEEEKPFLWMITNEGEKDHWGCLVRCPARGKAAFEAGAGCMGFASVRFENLQGPWLRNKFHHWVCSTETDKSAGNTFISACGLWFCLFVLLCTDLIGIKFRSSGIKCNTPFFKELPLTSRNFLSFLLPLD